MLRISGLLFIAFFYLISCTSENENKSQSQLAGMYKLQLIEVLGPDGWVQEDWGRGGEGYIIYDGLGHMAVHITPQGYKNFDWIGEEQTINGNSLKTKVDSMTVDELRSAVTEFASNYVYVADYTINDSSQTIQHKRLSHTIPAAWNSTVDRKFRFSGDTIILENVSSSRRLKWLRLK